MAKDERGHVEKEEECRRKRESARGAVGNICIASLAWPHPIPQEREGVW